MADLQRLEGVLGQSVGWNKARIKFLAGFVRALIQVRTVNLAEIAGVFGGKAQIDSNYKRIQRFLRGFEMPYEEVAAWVVNLIGVTGPRIVSMDRTDWKLGKTPINILTVGIVWKGIAFPVMWTVLGKSGNSNTTERKALVGRFVAVFGVASITYLCADREFIGKAWARWLKRQGIDFRIRIRKNTRVGTTCGKTVAAWTLFANLPVNHEVIVTGSRTIWTQRLFISGMRLADGDYLIVVTPGMEATPIADYAHRWGIETLFECLKSRGFNLEDTHLTQSDRLEKLMVLLTVAFCWSYVVGEWRVSLKALKIKKHGRRARSVFRTGLDFLRRILTNLQNATQLADFKKVVSLLSCT